MLLRRTLPYLLVLSATLAGVACAAPDAPAAPAAAGAVPAAIPALDFFQHAALRRVALSPDARYLAVRAGAPDRKDYLAVIDLATNKANVVAAFDDADVDDFEWVNETRLVFDLTEKNTGQGDVRHGPGLYAVDRDGAHFAQLADRYAGTASRLEQMGKVPLQPWNTFLLPQRPRKDDTVYVWRPVWDQGGELLYNDLVRLNTRTGTARAVQRPGPVTGWMLDYQGEPRLATVTKDGVATLHYRDPANGDQWRVLAQFPAYVESPDAFSPVGFGPDGTLYVTARRGQDTAALYAYDVKTGKLGADPLLVTKGYDFDGTLIASRGKLLGARFTTDAESIEWFDPALKTLQDKLDKVLPATVNLVTVPASDSPWVLVSSYSDAIPMRYALYNAETGQLNDIGSSRPTIDPRRMGRQQMVRYKARDGLEIPALLTLPRGGARNLPMVVLVHGGPWVHGSTWGWDAESQFLASRGYAVLEPAFRGSTGYGFRHYRASWKQWGLAMQNDVADGTRWAIAQGFADPQRICIAGASYGGYATLMGLVNDPDLYKCGVDWVGVTDINLMYSGAWSRSSDMTDQWKAHGMPELIGDRVKDAAQLKATSPIEQAARITQPVLLAYGGVDRRVPLYHGQKFYDAVTKTNKNVEWIEYPEEGHGWHLPKNSVDFWTRVEAFLGKNIGPQAGR